MLRRLSGAIRSGLAELDRPDDDEEAAIGASSAMPRYAYTRPSFLSLSLGPEEVTALAGYNVSRPILVAGDKCPLPGMAGYAEAINGGKSQRNEDQAQVCQFWLTTSATDNSSSSPAGRVDPPEDIVYSSFVCTLEDCNAASAVRQPGSTLVTYFALFDGHAGDGASTYARHRLQFHVRDRLQQVHHLLLKCATTSPTTVAGNTIGFDELVTGALESAFIAMDDEIGRNRGVHKIKGGCTALVTVFLLERVYIACAGDSRAVLCRGGDNGVLALTVDQTPHSDRQRLQAVAVHHPRLTQNEFSPLQFGRRLSRRDLGRRVLCRSAWVQGWYYKTVSEEDLLFPLITGDARKSRLLATIGVARGFGDHDLLVSDSSIAVKPFLSCVPQVVAVNSLLTDASPNSADYIVMATDGLWDVLSNDAAYAVVKDAVSQESSCPCVIAAQALVGSARGTWQRIKQEQQQQQAGGGGCWRMSSVSDSLEVGGNGDGAVTESGSNKEAVASLDDISCFVIPLGWIRRTAADNDPK